MIKETIQRGSTISFPFLWDIHINPPSYFMLWGRPIYYYGVIIAFGFLLGAWYCSKKAHHFGFTEDDVFDCLIALIPCSLIGARLYFVVFQWNYFKLHPYEIFNIWEGGIAIYGGIIAGILTLYIVSRFKKKSLPALMDLIVFGLLIGQALGRWGNFMNREAFGAQTDIFCRMGLTDSSGNTIYVHPTFLYESLWNTAGLVFLAYRTFKLNKRRYDGQNVLLYFLWYGLGRSWIELLRTDSLYIQGTNLRVSSLLSVILAIASAVLLYINSKTEHKTEDLYVNRIKQSSEPEQNIDK